MHGVKKAPLTPEQYAEAQRKIAKFVEYTALIRQKVRHHSPHPANALCSASDLRG
jgi:hypothetical protein